MGEIKLGGTTPGTIDVGNWQSGVSNENSELIGFRENGLIPISDLIADPAKKLAVEQYIAAYLQNKSVRTTISKQLVYSYWNATNTSHFSPLMWAHSFQEDGVEKLFAFMLFHFNIRKRSQFILI